MKNNSICPICSSNNSFVLWSASCSEQASHFLSPLDNKNKYEILKNHIFSLQKSYFTSINKCENCNFTYCFPYNAGDKKFYDLIFSKSNKYPQNRWEFEKSIEIIQKSNSKVPKILEIGSGDGAFIKKVIDKKLTTKDSITSIEYSAYGKKKIKSLGIECLSIDIKTDELDKLPYSKYDFICLFQVLEHLDENHKIMQILKSILKPNGEILIAVPNEKIIEFNENNGALLDMPPNHIGRWSKLSFLKYCDINNMNLVENIVEPFSFKNFILMFFSYRFLKKSQKVNSLEAYIKFKCNKNLVWLLTRLLILKDILFSPKILLNILLRVPKLGGESQLSRISKK